MNSEQVSRHTRANVNSFCSSLAHDQSSDPRESTMERVSDDSFVLMEKLCEQTMARIHDESLEDEEDLLEGIDVPNFNDTLEEVEFILEMGNKLKAKPKENSNVAQPSVENEISSICLSDAREATPSLQPPLKRLKLSSAGPVLLASTPNAVKPIVPNMLSFVAPMSEFGSCRSMINQSYQSPTAAIHQEKF